MASIYALKGRFQDLLRPSVGWLYARGVSANQVTIAAAVISLLVAALVFAFAAALPLLWALLPLWLFLRMALNAIDGMLAREFGQQSRLGACLNEVGDVVADAALYLSLLAVAGVSPWLVWLLVWLAALSEFCGVLGTTIGAERRYDGPMGKSDRAFVVGLLGLLLALGWIGATTVDVALLLACALCALTSLRRLRAALAAGEPPAAASASAPDSPVPVVQVSTMRAQQQLQFGSFDGTSLFYRHWPAAGGTARGAIVLLHRGHEHSGRVAHLADELGLPDFDLFAWDARGNGQSPGARGDAPGFEALVRDLDAFVAHIGHQHGFAAGDIAVVAQSVGAVVAATWVHDYAPAIRAMSLASPAFKVKLYVPFARPGLRLLQALRGNFFVNSYVRPQWLTHDPARVDSYRDDPLITRPISVRVLLGLYEAADRVVADAQAIHVPTQLLVSGADFVVHRKPQDRFYENLGASIKERHLLPGFFHDTLGERDRAIAVTPLRRFLLERFEVPLQPPDLLESHLRGPSFAEAERLAWPTEPFTLEDLRWRGTRAGLRFGGLLSNGIRLGLDTGFDSGSTLDYVYRNQAEGKGPIGRMIDRNYLDAIGWRGIRIRGGHLQALLKAAAARLRAAGRPVQVVDIAAGHGRYVLEALGTGEHKADAIRLRDYSALNVERGGALIHTLGAQDIARFELGDAFDRDALAALDPAPTLAVVSGLYELFPDNAMVRRSLEGLAAAMPPGALLLYTGQPWHPQLEFIARALTSHRQGQAWVMRRRSQAEMDQLVGAAGFRKIDQRIDRWGIFTVSMAERIDA